VKLSWRGANRLFFACAIVQFTAEGHLNAFTPLFLHELGLSPAEVGVWTGLLVGMSTGIAFPMTPVWGVLSERFSRRTIVLRTYYLDAICLLLTAWAPDVALLIPARMLFGLALGSIAVMLATQTLLVPRQHLGPSIALVQSALPIAMSLGPPIAALAIPWIGLRWVFAIDAIALLLAALALTLLMPEPAAPPVVGRGSVLGRTGEVLKSAWRIEPVRWNFICAASVRGASSVVDAYLPVRITQIAPDPAAAIGWILGVYGALTTVATWYVGRLVQRVEEATLYTRAVFTATLLTAGMALAPSLWLLGLLAILRSIPVAFGNTVLHAHNADVLPPAQRTTILSMSPMPRNFGAFVLPVLAAAVAGLTPGGAPLAVGTVGYAVSWLAGLRLRRATRAYREGGEKRSAPGDAGAAGDRRDDGGRSGPAAG
jgi:DHA1 family multidrug resistance protein-like MFS transporter